MVRKATVRITALFLLAVLLFVMSMGGFTVSYAYADTGGELNYDMLMRIQAENSITTIRMCWTI